MYGTAAHLMRRGRSEQEVIQGRFFRMLLSGRELVEPVVF